MSAMRRPSVVLLVAVVLAVALFAASQGADSAQSGPQAEMALVVNPDGAACTEVCTIPLGGTFTLAVEIVTAPAEGYIGAQTVIDFGNHVSYGYEARSASEEIVWPDAHPSVSLRGALEPGLVIHGALTSILPPLPVSTYSGRFLEIILTCSAADTSTRIDLLPLWSPRTLTSGTAFIDADGLMTVVVADSLQVDCGAGGLLDAPPPTRTPQPLPTRRPATPPIAPPPRPPSGPQAEMALVVNPAGAACTDVCSIPLNGTFTLAVDIVTAPTEGYIAAQTFVDYGDDLIYDIDARPAETEIVWSDLAPITAVKASMGMGLVVHAGVTGLAPPLPVSTYTGAFLEIELACSPDDTSTKIDLLPYSDPQTITSGTGFVIDPDSPLAVDREMIVPIVGSIQVDCGAGGLLDTPTPTLSALSTSTPTLVVPRTRTPQPLPTRRPATPPVVPPPGGGTGPTATPSGPLIEGDGLFISDDSLLFDDATTVAAIACRVPATATDAAAILRWHAGLTGGVPCGLALDVTRDGVVDSRDAAVVMQYAAGLLATLPP